MGGGSKGRDWPCVRASECAPVGTFACVSVCASACRHVCAGVGCRCADSPAPCLHHSPPRIPQGPSTRKATAHSSLTLQALETHRIFFLSRVLSPPPQGCRAQGVTRLLPLTQNSDHRLRWGHEGRGRSLTATNPKPTRLGPLHVTCGWEDSRDRYGGLF